MLIGFFDLRIRFYSKIYLGLIVKKAYTVPVFFDCSWYDAMPSSENEPPEWDGFMGVIGVSYNEMTLVCINRHDGYINCTFLDWSVRKVGLKELWLLKWHRNFDTAGPWTKAGGVQPENWPDWMRKFRDY